MTKRKKEVKSEPWEAVKLCGLQSPWRGFVVPLMRGIGEAGPAERIFSVRSLRISWELRESSMPGPFREPRPRWFGSRSQGDISEPLPFRTAGRAAAVPMKQTRSYAASRCDALACALSTSILSKPHSNCTKQDVTSLGSGTRSSQRLKGTHNPGVLR